MGIFKKKARTTEKSAVTAPTAELATILGGALKLKGHITGDDDLKIAGTFEGEVAIKGALFVADTAAITGDISARSISSEGDIHGMLTARDSVRLRPGSRMKGSLNTPQLTIEKGALLNGDVSMQAPDQRKPAAAAVRPGSSRSMTGNQPGQSTAAGNRTMAGDGVGGKTTPVSKTSGKEK